MRFIYLRVALLVVATIEITGAATTYELEAKKFMQDASAKYFSLYDGIAAEAYVSTSDEYDLEAIFSKIDTVKSIAKELVEISQEAKYFDLAKISDPEIKAALQTLAKAADLFVLGEDYFDSVLINMESLKNLAADKEIEPYMGGINMLGQDGSYLAYYPDIQKIFQRSTDQDELKYYWEVWREKNAVWSSIHFQTLVESFQKAADILGIPVLEFWYHCYDSKNFLREMEDVMEEIKPLYQQFHAFVRQELYDKYGAGVISVRGPIPDHLYQQVFEQAWTPESVLEKFFARSELPPYDSFVEHLDARQLIDEAERFYTSLGFVPLDDTFYKEQLKEQDEIGNMGDCRADIFDLTPKIYMKYCQKVEFRKFMQNHGYLSRVHYATEKRDLPAYFFDSYNLEYPVGEAVILSASTPKHLGAIGIARNFTFTDRVLLNRHMRMGIHTMFNIPLLFVHIKVMDDILSGKVELESINRHYWKLMGQYAGVEPPSDREEGAIDFPYSFYSQIDQNYQTKPVLFPSYRKFVSEVLGYQFYRAFCKKSNHTGPLHNCDFSDSVDVGNDLKAMMALGSTKTWNDVIAKVLPENPKLSGEALLEYYTPVHEWLKNRNKETGAKIGWNSTKKKIL